MAKQLLLLGASGDIGKQALDVLRYQYDYELVGIAFHSRYQELENEYFWFDSIRTIAITDKKARDDFLRLHPSMEGKVICGEDALSKLLTLYPKATVLNAISGNDGVFPTLMALKNNQDLLLANKESYVVGSSLMKELLKSYQGKIYPVDSEHVGLYKCLHAFSSSYHPVRWMITCSGGALRDKTREELSSVTPQEVLTHPTWKMSKKITVDCSTLVNKGYEVIEASEMFSVPLDAVEAKICRSSLIHAGIEGEDSKGNIRWNYEYSPCSMKNAISFALSKGKKKMHHPNGEEQLLLDREVQNLKPIDSLRYPLFSLTIDCFRKFGNRGMIYYNAVDSKAVSSFLDGKISYLEIESALFYVYDHMPEGKPLTFSSIHELIKNSEIYASQLLDKKPWRSL